VGQAPPGLGWSIGWLPDGQLLVTGERLLRREPDGSLVEHADLGALSGDWNEVVVDGRGNIYVNGGCDFEPGEGDPPGIVALVEPAGRTLFVRAAEWRGTEEVDEALAARTGQVLTVRAPAPHAGWP
jgi:sugar lactone lactonase YvrE